MNDTPGRTDQGQPTGAAIQTRMLSKTYVTDEAHVEALREIDLDIPGGRFVSVVGPSGCGKSTLMLLVAGLLKPTSGSVRVGERELTEALTDVGIVFQDHLLLEFRTALGNVLLQGQVRGIPLDRMEEDARELFDRLGLTGAERRWPHQLSGGMRQRVAIVRALIHDPSVLLMDEPFGALDAITRTQMRHDLERLWMETRKTVLFITHSVEEAVGLSDKVLVMSPGPGEIIEEIDIELPRPRPLSVGENAAFMEHAGRIYSIFEAYGVLKT